MASQLSSSEIMEIRLNERQFREWDADTPDADFVSHAKKAAAVAFERELTETQKRYYDAYYFQGISIPDIATQYGVNRATVSKVLKKANERLARVLRYSAPHLLNQPVTKRNRRIGYGKGKEAD